MPGGVQVIHRAVRILRVLAEHPEGLSLSQIAERAGLARSTVHRIVSALESERLLAAASPNGRVRLGLGLAALAQGVEMDLAREIHPFLVRLSRELHETVDLAVLEGDHALFIDQVAAPRRLRAVSAVGVSFPLHCTANGKALLAAVPREEALRRLPPELERFTPQTITDRGVLFAELESVSVEGVAYDREEHTIGICALGAVVKDALGRLACVTVPLPAQRFYGNEEKVASALLRTCGEMSAVLGSS